MRKNLLFEIITLSLVICLWTSPLAAETYMNPAVNGPETPSYWVDLGGLYATYGAYTAAIKAYEKALTLEPSSSAIQYDLAIAHAGLDQMDQALDLVNKAISLDSGQHRYHYARAWILLKSGRQAEAMDDFRRAAELGNHDAIAYLQNNFR